MSKQEKEDKNKKKKARKALLLFLKQLRKKCGSFKNVDEWYSFLKQNLDPIIDQYKAQISSDTLHAFEKARHLTDTTTDVINQACNQLQWNVEKVINMLPKHNPLAKVLIVGVAITAGIAAAAVLYIKTRTVTIIVKNRGCDQIRPVLPPMPISIPGFQFFEAPIPNGGSGTIKLYPIPVTVDATQKGIIAIGLLGQTTPFSGGSSAVRDIIFNGRSLIGKRTNINLREKEVHELIIACR